jgi:TonB family protein
MRSAIFGCALVWLLALSVGNAWADSNEATDAGPQHVLTKPPALTHFVQAEYPAEAKAQQLQGEVVLQIDLDAEGKVSDAQVLQSAGHGFDEAALAAVKQFQFSPAEIDGQPAPVRLTYRYSFVFTPEAPDAGPTSEANADGGAPAANANVHHFVTFDGTVLERGTRRVLPFSQVVARLLSTPDGGAPPDAGPDAELQLPQATTDSEGHFSFEDLPAGTYAVVVIATDHARFETEESVLEGQVTHATYFVRKEVYSSYETVVTAEREKKEVARTTLKQEEIHLIPGTFGDALKVVQNLPGVARAPYGIGLIIIRGSKPWDTRTYIDEANVPQLFHFGGLTAIFNADLLNDINFQPGNFNVDHGRAIGGLITAETRTPSTDGFHGYLNVNVIDSELLLEGPLSKDFSLALTVRRSYIDAVLEKGLELFAPDSGLDFTLAPRYYDFAARLDWHPSSLRDRVRVTFFGSDDQLSLVLQNPAVLDPEQRATFNSYIGVDALTTTWTHPFQGGWLTNKLTAYGEYIKLSNAFGSDLQATFSYEPLALKDTLDAELTKTLTWESGVDLFFAPYTYSTSLPQFFQTNAVPDPIISRQLVSDSGTGNIFEPGIFTQMIWKPTWAPGKATVVPGVRADYDGTMNKFWVDPRIAVLQAVGPDTVIKAAAGLYHQPPDFRQGYLLPKFGNPELGPEGSQQYMIGAERQIIEGLRVDVQLYYKWLFDQVQTSQAVVTRDGQQVAERYNNGGLGRSYGVEILLRQELTKRLFGWISYSLEKTELCSANFSISGVRPNCGPFGSGGWTPFPLDQPHHLIAVLSYKLPEDFIVGIRVQYSSGNPVTPVANTVYDADGDIYFPVPGKPLSDRTPPFFQLDARIDKRWVFEQWMLTLYLDVQNVTDRRNVEYTLYNFDYTQRSYLTGLPIVPALGIKGEF